MMEKLIGIIKKVIVVLAIIMSLYHLYTAAFGLPEALLHRSDPLAVYPRADLYACPQPPLTQ